MDFQLIKVLEICLLILIVFLAFKTIQITSDFKIRNKYILKGLIQDKSEREETQYKYTFFERLLSFSKNKAHIEEQLIDAKMTITAKRFIIQQFVNVTCIVVVLLILYSISPSGIYLILLAPLAIGAYLLPLRSITKNKNNYIYQMKLELPNYLSSFAVLLKSYTSYEATKLSVDYAKPILKPYVQRLATQIELYPTSTKPYNDFAKDVGLREVKEFMVALEQINKVDKQTSSKIIDDQINIMDELQEEAYNELIETRPQQVENFINPMLFIFVGIVFTFIFVLMSDSLSKI